ncbi:hypothetical protein PHJA_000424800 [Phtheirospermum japonicum]|uniref:RING-type domain-containing protein n=1 Tax=Phtheirospermum japonicum TaxID=374723 RepID=A0A830B6W5_9LAMI|nr:hypothetical protein PHJA_000424800 [Phtheirospermum japonicum]
MSDGETQQLVREALDFAGQRASENHQQAVIPVVVRLDVCTVQRDGELVNDAGSYLDRKSFLWELLGVRVEDEVSLALMEVCPVCSRGSVVGAQISLLPGCNHACHSRCVFEWLRMGRSSCSSCRARIPTDSERDSDCDSEI